MLDHYHCRLGIIEEVFEKTFLEDIPYDKLALRGKGQHPVRFHWRRARHFLKRLELEGTDLRHPSVAMITHIASVIEAARSLKGYASAFDGRRLKTAEEFEPALFEMETALVYGRSSEVQFVPRSDTRTPDLKITNDGISVWAECHRRERLRPVPISNHTQKSLEDHVSRLTDSLPPYTHVLVFCLGNDPAALQSALGAAAMRASEGMFGPFSSAETGTGIFITKTDSSPASPSGNLGVIIPTGTIAAEAQFTLSKRESGDVEFSDPKSIWICNMDTKPFRAILAKFESKRKQLIEDQAGILHFDLDLDNIDHNFRVMCLQFAAELLAQRAWSGGLNSRVKAMVMTCGHRFIQFHSGLFAHLLFSKDVTCTERPQDGPPDWALAPWASVSQGNPPSPRP